MIEVGILQVIQLTIYLICFLLIIKWIQSKRHCPCCTFHYETYIVGGEVKTVGHSHESLDEFYDSLYVDSIMYLEFDCGKYYLWTWITQIDGYEYGLQSEIKACPVCGRKLR